MECSGQMLWFEMSINFCILRFYIYIYYLYQILIKSIIWFSFSFFCRYEYHWADGTNIKKPIKCSAPKYIDYLMTWVQDQLDDETLFPSKIGLFVSFLRVFYTLLNTFQHRQHIFLMNTG